MEEKKPVYLIMVGESKVDASDNHNKYWNAFPLGDGTFRVEYGRVGAGKQTHVYSMSQWDKKIKEKLKKGYQDISDNMQDVIEDSKVETAEDTEDEFTLIKNTSVRSIIKRLFDYANTVIQSAYRVQANVVTQKMVDKAQAILDDLNTNYQDMSVEDFNEKLVKLFVTIPRKMKRVTDHLASKQDEFAKILEEEQSILDTMAGQVYQPKEKQIHISLDGSEYKESMLEKMGITMEDASDEDVEIIKKAMGDQVDKFYHAWKVSNYETQKAFNKFTSENNIDNVRLLAHGSRNSNFFNILKMGLKIRPAGAGYHGSLLGDCLYFSNPDKEHGGVAKSIGYTSLRGSYWEGGNSNCGFLVFFDVALGKSYDIYDFNPRFYSYDLNKLQEDCPDAWSLHLHGAGHRSSSTVINDEITVYDSRQVTVRYLVEIR